MTSTVDSDAIERIACPVTLRNGAVVRNRLVKAAMEEGIGCGGDPDERHRRLYARWAAGGWGIIITGNVQVDAAQKATAHDLCAPRSTSSMRAFTELRSAIRAADPAVLALAQVSHAGIQSSSTEALCRAPWVPAVGPVAARPNVGRGAWAWLVAHVLWPAESRALRHDEWPRIVELFVDAARRMEQCGWNGVQLHSAHGYLLAEYLSPLTNPDPKPLPGCPDDVPVRLHLLYLILFGIDKVTDRKFIKAVKINCSDFTKGGLDEAQSADVIKTIVSWDLVDVLEVSGGNYSNPAFMTPPTSARQALFAHFTSALIPDLPRPPAGPAVVLTGGLHSRALIADSLAGRACDLAGLGRPACVYPALPAETLLNPAVPDAQAVVGGYAIPGAASASWLISGLDGSGAIKLVGAGVGSWWHEHQLSRIGRGADPDMAMSVWAGIWTEWIRYGIWAWLLSCLLEPFARAPAHAEKVE